MWAPKFLRSKEGVSLSFFFLLSSFLSVQFDIESGRRDRGERAVDNCSVMKCVLEFKKLTLREQNANLKSIREIDITRF